MLSCTRLRCNECRIILIISKHSLWEVKPKKEGKEPNADEASNEAVGEEVADESNEEKSSGEVAVRHWALAEKTCCCQASKQCTGKLFAVSYFRP